MSPSTPEFAQDSGGSLLSRNALDGKAPIRWAFREGPVNPVDNGWRFLSAADDDEFLADPANLTIVPFNTVVSLEPAVLPLLPLPIGTDVTILRDEGGRITLVDSATGVPLQFGTPGSHALEVFGEETRVLSDADAPHRDQIREQLGRMDGDSVWGMALWRIPVEAEGRAQTDEIPRSAEYVQCAGSAQAMTIEVRRLSGGETPRQYTVGRATGTPRGEQDSIITWDGGRQSARVFANEVFDADEAAEVFAQYLQTGAVPPTCSLREIER